MASHIIALRLSDLVLIQKYYFISVLIFFLGGGGILHQLIVLAPSRGLKNPNISLLLSIKQAWLEKELGLFL